MKNFVIEESRHELKRDNDSSIVDMISKISKSRNKHPDKSIVFNTDECKKKTFVKSPANIISLKSYLNAPKSLFSMAKFDKFKIPPRTESNSKSKDSNNRSGLRSSVSKTQSKSKSKPKQTMLNNYTKKATKVSNPMSTSLDYKKINQKNNIGTIKTIKSSFTQPKKIMDLTYNTKKREEVNTEVNHNLGDNLIREVKSNLDDNYKNLFNFSYDMFLKDPESTRNEI